MKKLLGETQLPVVSSRLDKINGMIFVVLRWINLEEYFIEDRMRSRASVNLVVSKGILL